jgi:hypothetical protein
MRETDLASCVDLAERRRRFRWQAEVSGPGSSGVAVGEPIGGRPDLLDLLVDRLDPAETPPETGGSHA